MTPTSTTDYEQLTPEGAARVDEVCDRFEQAWRAAQSGGAVPRVAEFLEGVVESERIPLMHELIALDQECRQHYGHSLHPESYAKLGIVQEELLTAPPGPPREVSPQDTRAGWPRLPGFELEEVVGAGGMGVVYRARQAALDRNVAVKMLRDTNLTDASQRERFHQEARTIARLHHPHLVQVYEFGEVPSLGGKSTQPYLVLEYVGGGSLADHLHGQPLPPTEAARLTETLARAIQHAHEHGIIHRDLKPGNILLQGDLAQRREGTKQEVVTSSLAPTCLGVRSSVPKITDFGLARLELSAHLTQTGDILGTPSYMAPEQTAGKKGEITAATDVYGLGAILYECLTGRPPFRAETALATLAQVQRDDPVSPRRLQPTVPRDLETICLKCLHKEPPRRYTTAQELADDLHRFLEGQPILARPTGLLSRMFRRARRRPAVAALVAGLFLVTLLGMAGIVWQGQLAEMRRRDAVEARVQAETRSYFDRIGRAYHDYWWLTGDRTEQLLSECREQFPQLLHWEYRYLDRWHRDDLFTIDAHEDAIYCLDYSPDGKYLATATGRWAERRPGEIKVWDAATGRQLHPAFRGHKYSVYTLAFQPGGHMLASSGNDGTILLWNLDRPEEKPRSVPVVEGRSVYHIAFSPDGGKLFAACSDGRVRVVSVANGRVERAILGHPGTNVFAVAVSPNGRYLASAGWEGRVCIWDLARDELPRHFAHTSSVMRLAFSPDGKIVASATYDGVLWLWNLEEKLATPLRVNLGPINSAGLAFHPDGRYLAANTTDGHVRLIQVRGGGELRTLRGQGARVTRVAFSPDGRNLAAGTWAGRVKVWDLTAPQEPQVFQVAEGAATAIALSPDGRRLLAGGAVNRGNFNLGSTTAWLVQIDTGRRIHVLRGHKERLTSVAYRPDGLQLATGSADRTARLWDSGTGRLLHELRGHTGEVAEIAYDPAGKYLLTASADGTLRLWDANTGEMVRELTGHTDRVHAVTFVTDGQHALSGSADHTVRVWEVASGREMLRFTGHTGPVSAVKCSPAGSLIASADGYEVHLWDWRTGRAHLNRPIHLGPTQSSYWGEDQDAGPGFARARLAFSPDGRRLASVDHVRALQLWDTATGSEALMLPGVPRGAVDVAFSSAPGEERLFAGINRSAFVWDPNRPRPTAVEQARRALEWHRQELSRARSVSSPSATVFHASTLLKAKADDVPLLRERAAAYATLGREGEDKALADLEQAHALASNDGSHWLHRGNVFVELGRWDEAITEFRKAVDKSPNHWNPWYHLAIAHLGQGRVDKYRAVCVEMLNHFDATKQALPVEVTFILAPLTDPPEAAKFLQFLEQVYAKGGGDRVLGVAQYRAGQFARSITSIEKTMRDWPRAWTWLFLAMAYQRNGQPQEARENLALALDWIRQAEDERTDLRASRLARWFHWRERVEVLALRREAEALLQGR